MKLLRIRDEFFKQTGLMFIGVSLFNLFNLLYHFFMLRMLSPVDYSHLNTLLSLFMIISVPAGTVQTTVTKFVSHFRAQNQWDRVTSLVKHLLLVMLIIAFSVSLLISLGGSLLSSFLQISSPGLIFLFGVILFFAMFIPVSWGGLQGLQKFGSLSLNLIANGGIKLILGIALVFLGWEVFGALGAVAVSYLVTTVLSLLVLKMSLRHGEMETKLKPDPEKRTPHDFSGVYSYSLPVGLTLLCFMVLTNIDLILVKHYFIPIEAGYYSIAQMVGKVILFLPLPIVMVMFPEVSSLDVQKRRTFSVLARSFMMAGFLVVLGTGFCHFFPTLTIRMLTGKVYPECVPLVKLFSINMSFFSLTFILLYYHLATQRRGFLYPLVLCALVQSGLIILFHESLIQVLSVVSVVAVCLMAINSYLVYRFNEGKQKES